MYLGICEKENHIFVFHTSHLVQLPQVFVETVIIVPSAKFNLQTLVTTYMSCESREGLLSRASYTNQQCVAPFLADHPCNSAGSKGRKIEFRFTGTASAERTCCSGMAVASRAGDCQGEAVHLRQIMAG